MAIALTKTLQTVEYNLYGRTALVFHSTEVVVVKVSIYQSSGHYSDGFVPIITKNHNITDSTVVTAFGSYYSNSPVAINAAEDWLVANDAWYSGGSVVE